MMNSRSVKLAFFCFLLIACGDKGVPKEVLALAEQRMQLYREEQDSLCRAKVIQKAEIAVDSFFLSFTQRFLLDTIPVPPKPVKPYVDTSISLDPARPVKPLWDSLK